MGTFQIHTYNHNELTGNLIKSILKLIDTTWPPKSDTERQERTYPEINKASTVFEKHIICYDQLKIVGYGKIFERIIYHEGKHIRNLALASVCVLPKYQGKGVGTLIVKRAFSFVDSKEFECSIFQTGRKNFYKRLGAVQVFNSFTNSLAPDADVWWDDFRMIYPAAAKCDGPIDMNGAGY
ncbi:MAG: GNAT family N-acetyltransferase [Reichenbachiella sp.]